MALPLFAPRRAVSAADAPPPNTRVDPRLREVSALLLWTGAVFVTLALSSYEFDPQTGASTGADWVGPVGQACARVLVSLVGIAAWAVPVEAVLLGVPLVRGKKSTFTLARAAGDLLILLIASALVQVGWAGRLAFGHHTASGAVGELFGELARSLFSTVGSFLVGFALLGLILIARAAFSFIALLRWVGALGEKSAKGTAAGAKSVAEAWRTAREIEREKREKERIEAMPHIVEEEREATIAVLPPDEDDDPVVSALAGAEEAVVEAPKSAPPKRTRRRRESDGVAETGDGSATAAATPTATEKELGVEDPAPTSKRAGGSKRDKGVAVAGGDDARADHEADAAADFGPADFAADLAAVAAAADAEPKLSRRRSKKPEGPTIVDTSAALAKEKEAAAPPAAAAKKQASTYRFPSLDLLVPAKVDPTLHVDRETLLKNADLLVKTLADYGVSGKVEDILPGPTVTTFEVSPAAGTKVSKVASLADDLALALARKVRIVAPIPGKNRIGFELPNERRVPVNLRDLVEDRRFQQLDAPLPVVLGRDILGSPVYADLASMPHVIVAGATGAGKSVGLNVMLTSLLYRRSPDELRLLMIDPKVVELAPFDRIPHMLLPVVTDMKQAATALKWAVDEMERRYQLFADAGTKNIGTFNAWCDRVARGEAKNPLPKTSIAKDPNGFADEVPDPEGEQKLPEKLPLIVIVVDEFADLMMQQGKEVEAAVARLAQKARAAGMHVILATQRPSVDVITGMIKANFPTRIAYRVAQKVDSRTILDEQGAEHLLGRGDMLIKLNGTNETKRVQCPMVSEEEVQAVTDVLRAQGEPVYDDNILKPRDDDDEAQAEDDAEQDAMYDDAVRMVADTRRCSTSWLQRKLGLGYNRAARIVEMMERRGLVGPANGAKDREVLIEPI